MTALIYTFVLGLVLFTIFVVGIIPLFAMAHRHELSDTHENES